MGAWSGCVCLCGATSLVSQDITEAKYYELEGFLTSIDLSQVKEEVDNTDLSGEAACAGGACEITF